MLAYKEQITRNASQITHADIQRLRNVGFTDLNIADIALAASFRSFMSCCFDAVGARVERETWSVRIGLLGGPGTAPDKNQASTGRFISVATLRVHFNQPSAHGHDLSDRS